MVGDPDQLPPVGVGTTFADLVGEGGGPGSAGLAAFVGALGLGEVPDSTPRTNSRVSIRMGMRPSWPSS